MLRAFSLKTVRCNPHHSSTLVVARLLCMAAIGLLACCVGCKKSESAQEKKPDASHASVALTTATLKDSPTSQTKAGEIVFNLKYRGWDEKDKANFFCFSGSSEPKQAQNSFIQSLHLSNAVAVYVALPSPTGSYGENDYGVLECGADGQLLAFYFDLNRNGKFDEGERITSSGKGLMSGTCLLFITPDYEVTVNGKKYTTRVAATVDANNKEHTSYTIGWSPACCLEGTAMIDGQEWKLSLYEDNPGRGIFTKMRTSKYALTKTSESNKTSREREPLTRFLSISGQWYEARFSDDNQKLILTASTVGTGTLFPTVYMPAGVITDGVALELVGTEDQDVHFVVNRQTKSMDLPAIPYNVTGGGYEYWPGAENSPDKNKAARKKAWDVGFQMGINDMAFHVGTPLKIQPNQITYAEFGKPQIFISAFNRAAVTQDKATTQTLFQQGNTILLSCQVRGQMNETYHGFVSPLVGERIHLIYKIVDASGTQVASDDKSGDRFSWETGNAAPGKYTVIVEHETGPLAGKLEAKLEIEIQAKSSGTKAATPSPAGN